ncbi:MAG: helix-turn-helix transcriptional regulator [Clostridium sp.]
MISANLKRLRKINQFTQEGVAEKINVSRQSVAKWESGETLPDLESCMNLAKLYSVKLDDLINHSEEDSGVAVPPKGKFFYGKVKIGEKDDIVIPKEAMEQFKIKPGDELIILGDEDRGMAIVPQEYLNGFMGMAGAVATDK